MARVLPLLPRASLLRGTNSEAACKRLGFCLPSLVLGTHKKVSATIRWKPHCLPWVEDPVDRGGFCIGEGLGLPFSESSGCRSPGVLTGPWKQTYG